MSHVRDMSLAESGRMKIRWVQDFMPALVAIRARFEREKPFAGKKITISIHMEAKTAFLALCLAQAARRCMPRAAIPCPRRTTWRRALSPWAWRPMPCTA